MTPMRPTAPARSVRDPGKSRNGEDAMRIILSIHDAFLKIHPSRPATRAKVPTAAVKFERGKYDAEWHQILKQGFNP